MRGYASYKRVIAIGISVLCWVVLWSITTGTAEASTRAQPAQEAAGRATGQEVPWSEMDPVGRTEWVPRPARRNLQHLEECALRRGRPIRRRRGKRGKAARRFRAGQRKPVQRSASQEAGTIQTNRAEPKASEGEEKHTTSSDIQVRLMASPWQEGGQATGPATVHRVKSSETMNVSEVWGTTCTQSISMSWCPTYSAPVPTSHRARAEEEWQGSWVEQELARVNLGDQRLNRRVRWLVKQFAAKPTASIPGACGGQWPASKAAYRFFDNAQVSHAAILAAHRQASLKRIGSDAQVLVMHDTTSLNYAHHPETEGLGPLENEHCRGLLVHSGLAVSASGVPLGVLAQQVWARDPDQVGQKHKRKKRPIEEKESFRWLTGLKTSMIDRPGQAQVIHVGDREADLYEFFQEAQDQQCHVLVRAYRNRNLTQPEGHLLEIVAQAPLYGEFSVPVGRKPDRRPRQATLEVRFCPVRLKPPRRPASQLIKLRQLNLYAIEVREVDPPKGEKALYWLLLTNLPVESFEQAQVCVRWYTWRWLVERYHYVLKSGCQIEARQLETAPRLERCLAVYAIVAWRLLWLTYQSRFAPDSPCTLALQPHEWQALYCYVHKTPVPPDEPPSLHQATRWIAQLGGFLGRKHDGEPGVKVLWRGWQRLNDIAQVWLLTHPTAQKDVGNA
jgi:hypothetical protein